MSRGYSEALSRLSPLDWCSYLRREGPRGLLGAAAIARLCSYNPEGLGVELDWHGASIGRGLRALLGGPPRLSVRAPRGARILGAGGLPFNPLLHRRFLPAAAEAPFPGCVIAWGRAVGVPELEPLQAGRDEPCSERSPRPSEPPAIGGAGLSGLECSATTTPQGRRLVSCSSRGASLLYSGGHALASGRLVLETGCADYMVAPLHPGGPLWLYAAPGTRVEANAVAVKCPGASLYAASPEGVRLELGEGLLSVEGLGGRYALGSGGALAAARALFELAAEPGYRAPTALGHARCSNCAGAALPGGGSVVIYAWSPTERPAVLEVRFQKPVAGEARVVDALGEDWVPVERGLLRVALPPGWHVVVEASLEEGRLAEVLREKLSRLGGGSRGSSRRRTP